MKNEIRVQTLALVGSYVPRQCGIATFTKDLRDALAEEGRLRPLVLAMDDMEEGYAYPDEVRFQIRANRLKDYQLATDVLNINQIDVVVLQHEYGLFGGHAGENIISLVRNTRMPVITTLHTLLEHPNNEQAAVMRQLIAESDRLVVMSRRAHEILAKIYKAPVEKVVIIPHGIPDVPFVDPSFYKDRFDLAGRSMLLTFGLLSPGKGLETAIRALPKIVKRHPSVMYVILGAIHPHVFKREGNSYLNTLERLAEKLGVREHVQFHNRYVTQEELCMYLGAADLYLLPYPRKEQITSGTLAYAMGTGKAVVSTPFWHAEEMLADGRGLLFPFGDADALADSVDGLLEDPLRLAAMRKQAYMYCRPMVWKEVARDYLSLAQDVLRMRQTNPRALQPHRPVSTENIELPEINLNHLRIMTDDTGILQHAIYTVPDRRHGYCTDDNSRALAATMLYWDLTKNEKILPLARIYLSFLHHAYQPEKRFFRNFMGYNREWLKEADEEDVFGRALWGLGLVAAMGPDEGLLALAGRLFCAALPGAENLQSPRAWAFTLVGCHAYLRRFSGDSFVRRMRDALAAKLFQRFQENGAPDWPWCEDILTYANGKLPHALILSGQWMPNEPMMRQGLDILEWLIGIQLDERGRLNLVGNRGWMIKSGNRAQFDQQPIDAMALAEACAEAYRCTKDDKWLRRAHLCLEWFLGNNVTETVLYDSATGGCRDGLHANGSNLNEGAESTIAWLISLLTLNLLQREEATGIDGGKGREVETIVESS